MKKLIAVSVLCLALAVILVLRDSAPAGNTHSSNALDRSPADASTGAKIANWANNKGKDDSAAGSLGAQPLGLKEKESITGLLSLMAAKEKLGQTPEQLFEAMGQMGLSPRAARSQNEYTGSLFVVRTNNALPGTRYFHAQLFQDTGRPGHIQHTSFEIRPGSDSMSTALSLVQQTHPQLGVPVISQDDYVLWKNNGRVVSVKRLGPQDLDNHFNAHSPEDVGSIWVVSEDEPEHGEI